jgi:hypothetical protein
MSDGREVDEIGQQLSRTGAVILSAALATARMVMQRRAERAEQARRADQQRQQDVARELHAERQLAAVQWERVNLRQWFRENPQEVAETWASAASWAEHDPRAKEAFESLNLHLDRLDTHGPEVRQAAFEANGYQGLAELLKQGADEAYGRLTGHSAANEPGAEAANAAPAEDAARWEQVGLGSRVDSVDQLGELWASTNVWADYDPRAAEAFESLTTELTRHNVAFPSADEVGPDPAKSQALAELLDNGAAQEAGLTGLGAQFVEFGASYIRDPASALARLDSHLEQIRTEHPEHFAALEDAAASAGADTLTTWYVNHLDDAYMLTRDYNAHGLAQAAESRSATTESVGREGTDQRTVPQSTPGQIYQNGTRAPWLAGLGFAKTTAASVGRGGGKHRRTRTPRAASRRVAARMARGKQEHGRD